MNRLGTLLLCLCATGPVPDQPITQALAEAGRMSLKQRKKLTAYYEHLDAAEAAGRAFDEVDPTEQYVRELLEKVQEYSGTEGSIPFRALIVQSSNVVAERIATAQAAVRENGSSPHLTPLVAGIRWSLSGAERVALLDAILAVNDHPRVRAEALLTRAGQWLPSRRRPEVPEEEIQRGVAELRQALEEAKKIRPGGPVVATRLPVAPDVDLLASIEGRLFQVERLRIGLVAPDIVGEDLEGVEFKLSDYRGKVVMLDFWGHW